MSTQSIPDGICIGHVHLKVADLDRRFVSIMN